MEGWLGCQHSRAIHKDLHGIKRQFRNALERAITEDEGKASNRPDMDERAAHVVQQIAREVGLPVSGTMNRGK